MFGWFKPRMAPEGPVEIRAEVEIERPAEEFYAMIDFGDPQHYKNDVGTVTRTGEKSFVMTLDMLPDLTFPITELHADPGRSYMFESVLPAELDARLHKTVEQLDIEPLGENRCKAITTTLAHFHPMKMKHYDVEVAMIATSCNNSLAKLKIHAEQGVETIREIEAQQAA